MSDLDRRTFLRYALGGGAVILPGLAWLRWGRGPAGGRRSDHYFVFYYMMGGWDLTLVTEPRPETDGISVQYRPDEVVEAGGHRFGPAMAPLRPFFDRMSVVRGISVYALNHPQARFLVTTGKFKKPHTPPSTSIQTILADRFGERYELPNLSSDGMRPATFLGDAAPHLKPLRIGSVDELEALSSVKGAPRGYAERVAQAVAERDAARAVEGTPLDKRFATYSELARRAGSSDIAARLQQSGTPLFEPTKLVSHGNRWGRQAHLAIEVLRHDLAPVITAGSGEFDAHNSHDYGYHRQAVTRGMETVAAICHGLEAIPDGAGTLLDRTTVVVTSEFARTPYINELGGKHHWPNNSMVIIGKGAARRPDGPVMFGESDEMTFPQPIDPATGAHEGRGADDLTTQHGLATILAMAGIDPLPHFGVEPIPSLLG